MNRVAIQWAGERLVLFADKALFWPRARTLLAADIHLGKAAAFRHAGIAVPEQVTAADLERLTFLLLHTRAERLLVLGDLFHAPTGQSEVMLQAFAAWRTHHRQLNVELLPGNHDAKIGPLSAAWNISVKPDLREKPFFFSHQEPEPRPQRVRNRQQSTAPTQFGIFGHVHPAVRCAGMRLPCFVVGESRVLLPAFGSFTGTHVIQPARLDRIFAVSEGEIAELSKVLFTA